MAAWPLCSKDPQYKGGKAVNQQYDVIVIGTGEKTRSTVRALSEQGQQVMYIELLPEMLTTMVCHRPKKNPSSQEYKTNKAQNQRKAKIHLQKQTMQTSAGETITYTFHVEETVELTEVERVETDAHMQDEWESQQHPYLYQSSNHQQPNAEPYNLEFVDDFMDTHQSAESNFHDHFYYEEESNANHQQDESIFYEIDEDPIEKEKETIDFTEEVHPSQQEEVEHEDLDENIFHNMSHTLKPSTLSQQKEREHEIREKLIRRKGKPESTNLLTGDSPIQESSEEQPKQMQTIYNHKDEEMDRSAFLHSVLNKPSYSPKDTRLRKRLIYKPKIQQTGEKKNVINPNLPTQKQDQDQQKEKQNVYSFEPLSSRRRARAQKKNRMLTNIQHTNPKPVSMEEQQQPSLLQEQTEAHESSETSSQPYLEESASKQPYVVESSSRQATGNFHTLESTQPNLQMQEDSVSDSLKKDDIEFEEPYGGYNSLEDFFPPYSKNRKRQEMDEIEKRKIALRGLHNLINNLG